MHAATAFDDALPGSAALRAAIDAAPDLPALAAAAARIRALAAEALDAGADVPAVTALISGLNDAVTVAVVRSIAAAMDVDLARGCWLVFGSQARGEQTLLTDQDNGIVFAAAGAADAEAQRPRWMRFGQRINHALADCGYALCDGNVMAGQPLCCLTADEWCRRFGHWMEHGSSNDLFAARLYFDLRVLHGNAALAQPLLALLRSPAAALPRFVKQMADSVLCNHVPLNWRGAVRPGRRDGRVVFDLKMSGTALFVDAARLWALAHSIDAVGTVPRLHAAAAALHVPPRELQAWLDGFQALQRLRLQAQRAPLADPAERCHVDWATLAQPERLALRRALRAARWVHQRIALDYCR